MQTCSFCFPFSFRGRGAGVRVLRLFNYKIIHIADSLLYLCGSFNSILCLMIATIIKNVKKNSFVHLRDDENSPLWIRGCFDRVSRRYSLISYDDSCKELLRKGTIIVYVENEDDIRF